MIFSTLVAQFKDRLSKRAELHRLVSEINSLSSDDLADIRGNRAEMIYQAHRQIYGDRSQ
jgi:hypothetical protein